MLMTRRVMFATCVIAVLCLVSLSHSVALDCEASVRPLDELDPDHLEGRWALIAGSFPDPAHLDFFKRRDSTSINFSNINFSNTNSTTTSFYTASVHFEGKCYSHSHNVSLEGSILNFIEQDEVNLTVTFLHVSSPDCVVMRYDNSKKLQRLLLFSRRREVNPQEMEEFSAQVKCLDMLPPAVMDPTKELCQEHSGSDSAVVDTERKPQ